MPAATGKKVLGIDAPVALRISAAGLAVELVIALSTVLPNAPVVPQGLEFALFPGIFVVHLRSVLVLKGREKRGSVKELMGGLPPMIRLAFLALFLVAWIVGVMSIVHIGGQPTQIHGRYYLNDHGTLIAVTHSGYLHALVLQQRIFTLIPSVFYALGVIVNWPLERGIGKTGMAGLRAL